MVPFPPGGGADNLARAIVPKASQILGVPIVIDNKPGAGGNIGAAEVARAAPDGYTLLQGTNGTHGINQALYAKTGFDPLKDFVPVARFTVIPAMLVVNPGVPADQRRRARRVHQEQSGQGLVRVRRQRHHVASGRHPLRATRPAPTSRTSRTRAADRRWRACWAATCR